MGTIQDQVALAARRAMCSATDEEIEEIEASTLVKQALIERAKVPTLSAEIFTAIGEVSSQIADESFCTYTPPTKAQRKRFIEAISAVLLRATK